MLDAEYSRSLDRIVAVSTSPSALAVVDPATGAAATVELPLEPAAVAVAPDGRTAAVAHHAFVSIVDLAAPALSVTIPTTTDAVDIVLAGNGFAYVFPRTDQWVDIHSVEIATKVDHGSAQGGRIYAGTRARLHPGGAHIYGITTGLSPTDMERYDISGGVVSGSQDSPYHGDHPMCAELWFTEPGDRIFTGCGTVFRTAPGTQEDMTYAGALGASVGTSPQTTRIRWIAHSQINRRVYALAMASGDVFLPSDEQIGPEETQVRVYGDDFLTLQSSLPVPCLATPLGSQPVYGRFVFVSSSGTSLYVLGRLDPNTSAALDWALATIAL